MINGVIGLVWAKVWWSWFRDRPQDHKGVNAAELDHIIQGMPGETQVENKIPFGQIVTSPNMLLAMYQYIASNITLFVSFTWLLPYMQQRWGPDAVRYAWIPLFIGAFAHWSSGGLGTFLHERGHQVGARRIPAILGFALGAFGLILSTQMGNTSPLGFVLCFSVAVFGVEMTISPSWSFCMDIGGSQSGAVSGAMNMLGNIGSAASAIIFPYFVDQVTIPFFAPQTGTANSFFVFAAVMNVLACVAWLSMNPKKKMDRLLSRAQVRLRLTLFVVLAVLLVAGLLLYKILYL